MLSEEKLSEDQQAIIRTIARRSWSTEESDEELMILAREPIQQCDGGYWVPALVFVADSQVSCEEKHEPPTV